MNKSSVIALLIAAGIAAALVGYMLRGEETLEQGLVRAAEGMNKNLPMALDEETRMESCAAGPGMQLTFHYTMFNRAKSELKVADVEKGIRLTLLARIRSSPDAKKFRDNSVTLHNKFKDKLGEELFDIVIAPSEL